MIKPIKLTNKENGFKLHSHSVSYGNSGSGQQSVTGFEHANDANSYFMVREGFKDTPCTLGEPIKCNSIIRLYHTSTNMYLHSHQGFNSPLSGRQEVSAFDRSGAVVENIKTFVRKAVFKVHI